MAKLLSHLFYGSDVLVESDETESPTTTVGVKKLSAGSSQDGTLRVALDHDS